ncbi:hypothetical protein [Undibacterium rugosum]|uniref:hypothetical protein n=1 Tax=Undibacterium rugosum TaxID=2762291 RepID=UPI001B811FEB|nr:hypothetical protein [Undibacterium rugosum]MBR7780253.1 hypothetical protein [Undibacterium rugosum]
MIDFELRLAALSHLIDNRSEAVALRLSEEYRRVETVLTNSADYDELFWALKTAAVLAPRFHRAVVPLLLTFVRAIPSRILTQEGTPIAESMRRYRSASHLIREAIDVLNPVRYLYIESVVDFLLELSSSIDDAVSGKAARMLERLAKFDLDVFYGERGLGAEPQSRVVKHFSLMVDSQLKANAQPILSVLRNLLSPSAEGHSWTYSTLTISRAEIMSGAGIAEMRDATIELLKRMYSLEASVAYRKVVLNALNEATRHERPIVDSETTSMFDRDALNVLTFLRQLVPNEPLPLVQKIEHQAYWNYYHAASPAIEVAALAVRDVLLDHAEYQIYKQLIGFEGIFGNWEELRRSKSAWDYTDSTRRAAAQKYVEEINSKTYEHWRARILEFSKTRSDDLATFPVYFDFLESIGREKPVLALELVTAHAEVMSPFLVALLRGLWTSEESKRVESIIEDWLAQGVNLNVIAKSLFNVGASRLGILNSVIAKSLLLDDRGAIVQVMGVAASLYAEGHLEAKGIFMHALRELSKLGDTQWVANVWFSGSFRSLVCSMSSDERSEVLTSLASLSVLNYQAEEILFAIAEQDVQSVLDYLVGRLKRAREQPKLGRKVAGGSGSSPDDLRFEAIPYDLHMLDKVFTNVPSALLEAMRSDFAEEERGMFTYRGARLITATFTKFEKPLEEILLKFVAGDNEEDIAFVLAILRAYDGSDAIFEVCKAIIKVTPEGSEQWNEVAVCIRSTGVVSGEYGMVNAFEHKRSEIALWEACDSPHVQIFARWFTKNLESMIEYEKQRADEDLALRKYKYGEGS